MIFLKYFLNIFIFSIFNSLFYLFLEKRYINIYNKNKLRYITKNIVKSIILYILFVYTIFVNDWSNENIYNYGIIYASHDILSLIMYYDILSIIITLLILYYGFISFFFDMEPKNCVSVKSIKKSLSLTKSNRSINSNSFKSFSRSNSFKSL